MSYLKPFAVLVTLTVALVLTGCAPSEGYADLDKEKSDADTLPSDLPAYASDGFAIDTVRSIRHYNNAQLFLAKGKESQLCLMVYRDKETWVGGCGSSSLNVNGAGMTVRVIPDSGEVPAGWEAVSENVLVKRQD